MPMPLPATTRLYWQDDHLFETEATVVDVRADAVAFDQTVFYPGGGGQLPDTGRITLPDGQTLDVVSAHADTDEVLWHVIQTPLPPDIVGQPAHLHLDQGRRLALMRYHTVLHVLNTITLRDYDGWITGVQIGADYSRIDFKLDGFSAALCAELETKVNAVLTANHRLKSYFVSEEEFGRRRDLLRTLEAQPPVYYGHVRVVEIEGFDAQACGGTHVHNTGQVGRFSVFRMENKGKINKRMYVRLDPPEQAVDPREVKHG